MENEEARSPNLNITMLGQGSSPVSDLHSDFRFGVLDVA